MHQESSSKDHVMRQLSALILLPLAACSTTPTKMADIVAVSEVSLAKLALADGTDKGVATISQRTDGLWLEVAATKMAPGSYGIHLHAVGKCDGPDFTSAGPHWNPAQKQHGFDNPMGAHAGDLRNLVVGADGGGSTMVKLPDVPFSGDGGALDADGLAIVIHEKPDDYSTDPSGNSGKRIVCGVFAKE
jgi:superoxide dismutase, Cu-Zn family